MRAHPDAFSPEAGAWGRSGCTRVRLETVDEDTLGEAMTLAWQHTGASAKVKSAKARTSRVRSSAKKT
jgi:hypothetical protein